PDAALAPRLPRPEQRHVIAAEGAEAGVERGDAGAVAPREREQVGIGDLAVADEPREVVVRCEPPPRRPASWRPHAARREYRCAIGGTAPRPGRRAAHAPASEPRAARRALERRAPADRDRRL